MDGSRKGSIETAQELEPRRLSNSLYTRINRWQTRVVLLHPGHYDDPIVTNLVVADIVHLPGLVLHNSQKLIQYDAISYAWGDGVFDHHIQINGQDVSITRTLHEALRRSRAATRPQSLWVDALSICQSHPPEKSFQVQNMFTIFRKAASVLVWLGEAAEHTGEAVEVLRNESVYVNPPSFGPGLAPNVRQGMLDLCSRSWISRAWVQQEVFASQDITVFCGDHAMTLAEFKLAARAAACPDGLADPRIARNLTVLPNLRQATEVDLSRLGEQRGLQSSGICRHIRRSGRTTPQLKGLVCCTRPECVIADLNGVLASEPRDRVYALLALTDCQTSYQEDSVIPGSPFLPINYAWSVSQVFQSLTKCLMNRDRALDLLALHERSRARDLRLPSWTPDWREWRWHRVDLEHKHTAHEQRSFPREKLQRQIVEDWEVLKIKGRVYGTFSARFGDLLKLVDREPSGEDDKPSTAYFRDTENRVGLRIAGPIPTEEALEAITDFDSGEVSAHGRSSVRKGDLLIQGPGEIRPLMMVIRPRDNGEYKFVEAIASFNVEAWSRSNYEIEFGGLQEFALR